ncbi:FlgO family outer membrane protein [Desulfovibrio psychrotolerans]|nr:FlgO family outer membrane protein [Desulfovibrio psychrotolerans]
MSGNSHRIFMAALLAATLAVPAQAQEPYVPQGHTPVMNAVDFGALSSGRAEQFDPVTAMRVSKTPETVMMDGMAVPMRSMRTIDSGIVVPDGNGGLIWREGARPEPDPSHVAARELKLKVRELADQLLSNIDRKFMKGVTAMPVSLVNQDDFEESSSFGRYMAEALFYEFNQRGFPVREYRGGDLVLRKGEGEFLLSRAQQQIYVDSGMTMFVAGTYYQDKQNVFVNVRMFRAADGMVLRTAQLVFPQSDVSRRMLANTGKRLEETYVGMNDYDMLTRAFDLTAFDLGEDFH